MKGMLRSVSRPCPPSSVLGVLVSPPRVAAAAPPPPSPPAVVRLRADDDGGGISLPIEAISTDSWRSTKSSVLWNGGWTQWTKAWQGWKSPAMRSRSRPEESPGRSGRRAAEARFGSPEEAPRKHRAGTDRSCLNLERTFLFLFGCHWQSWIRLPGPAPFSSRARLRPWIPPPKRGREATAKRKSSAYFKVGKV